MPFLFDVHIEIISETKEGRTLELEMSEEEICKRFNRNGRYLKHIYILAELNAVDDVVICEILERHHLLNKRPKRLRIYNYEG